MLKHVTADRRLIIHADDLGMARSTNKAIYELFVGARITSASLMVPCAAAREAAELCVPHQHWDIGVHLTLTSSENDRYKPAYREARLPGLTTPDGFLPFDASEIELYADPEEVRLELEAQIKTALSWGLDLTHLDSHGGSIMGLSCGRDFLEIVFDLCEKYGLPFHLPLRTPEQPMFNPEQKRLFAERIASMKRRGILTVDDVVGLPYPLLPGEGIEDMKAGIMNMIKNIGPGITQIVTHPSIVTEELMALTFHYEKRGMEYRLFMDADIRRLIEQENIKLITWRDIRDMQRRG